MNAGQPSNYKDKPRLFEKRDNILESMNTKSRPKTAGNNRKAKLNQTASMATMGQNRLLTST